MYQKYVLKTSCDILIKLKMSLLPAMQGASTEPELLTHHTEEHFGTIIL